MKNHDVVVVVVDDVVVLGSIQLYVNHEIIANSALFSRCSGAFASVRCRSHQLIVDVTLIGHNSLCVFQIHSRTCGNLQAIAGMLELQLCLAGDFLIREGDLGHEMYFVRKGLLEVIKKGAERDRIAMLGYGLFSIVLFFSYSAFN